MPTVAFLRTVWPVPVGVGLSLAPPVSATTGSHCRGTTSTLVTARKQSWCLAEVSQHLFEPWVPQTGFHDCTSQGQLPGLSDIYSAGLECQWLGVTDIAPGVHNLTAEVNSGRHLHESNDSLDSKGRWRPLSGVGTCGIVATTPSAACRQLQ